MATSVESYNSAVSYFFPRREQPQLIVFPVVTCTFLTVCFLPQSHRHTTFGLIPCPLRSFITVRRPNRFPVKSMKGGIVYSLSSCWANCSKEKERIILSRALDCNTSRTAGGW